MTLNLAGDLTRSNPYEGDLSEVNLWDRALSTLSVKQLAALKDKWKFPGNVVSWSQLAGEASGALELIPAAHTSGEKRDGWQGLSTLVQLPPKSWKLQL